MFQIHSTSFFGPSVSVSVHLIQKPLTKAPKTPQTFNEAATDVMTVCTLKYWALSVRRPKDFDHIVLNPKNIVAFIFNLLVFVQMGRGTVASLSLTFAVILLYI